MLQLRPRTPHTHSIGTPDYSFLNGYFDYLYTLLLSATNLSVTGTVGCGNLTCTNRIVSKIFAIVENDEDILHIDKYIAKFPQDGEFARNLVVGNKLSAVSAEIEASLKANTAQVTEGLQAGSVSVDTMLQVEGSSWLKGGLTVQGNSSIYGNLTVNGNIAGYGISGTSGNFGVGSVTAGNFYGNLHGTADYATNAGYATNANTANNANYATNAGNANYATNAGSAAYATNAGHANTADSLTGGTGGSKLYSSSSWTYHSINGTYAWTMLNSPVLSLSNINNYMLFLLNISATATAASSGSANSLEFGSGPDGNIYWIPFNMTISIQENFPICTTVHWYGYVTSGNYYVYVRTSRGVIITNTTLTALSV